MIVCDPRAREMLQSQKGGADPETLYKEALRSVQHHFTPIEFSELIADVAAGKLDVRVYDDGIVLRRSCQSPRDLARA
jgi:hypothetical protein